MEEQAKRRKKVAVNAYKKRAENYDATVKIFDKFSWLGFSISGWRKAAISKLEMNPGDTIIDIGCGTGLNFPYLQQGIGAQGRIIGIDISEQMLAEARHLAEENDWENVELIWRDAGEYTYTEKANGIISTYAMTLIPEAGQVITKASEAITGGGKMVILDMAWPRYCPLWWRHVLYFLKSYGVTAEVLKGRPWEQVQKAMEENLSQIEKKIYWFGFFHLTSGIKMRM